MPGKDGPQKEMRRKRVKGGGEREKEGTPYSHKTKQAELNLTYNRAKPHAKKTTEGKGGKKKEM